MRSLLVSVAGALIGAALLLPAPKLLVITLPLALLFGGAWWALAMLQFGLLAAVMGYAAKGAYPWWMLTPDDPVSPFGQYEATVRRVYARAGRYLGDVYWLAWRNVLYGVRYALKPAKYKQTTDYSVFETSVKTTRWLTTYSADGLLLWQVNLGRFELLAGWMVRGVALDPKTPRQLINMEFRPTFSPRKAG